MPKYKVYVNAGIEIWDTIDAPSMDDARVKAYNLIGHRVYENHIEVEEIKNDEKNN